MFRSRSGEGHFSGGQSSSSPTGHGVTSSALDSQESSWIGLLSVVSRPALSFLQKYLLGRDRPPALSEQGSRWSSGDLKNDFVGEESEFLRQLDDIMPLTQHQAPHLTYLQCQQEGAAGLPETSGGSTLPWLTADSLREIGIQNAEEIAFNLCQQNQIGYFTSARTFLSHVRLNSVSSQEIKLTGGKDWAAEAVSSSVKSSVGKSRMWWSSFWRGEETSQKGLLSDLSWTEVTTMTGRLCPQQPEAETKAPAAETTHVFVQSDSQGWTLGENTRPTDNKEEPANDEGLQTSQNTEGSTPDNRLSISDHLSSPGAAACSEVALLTPDQDNGYSSLEEGHLIRHLCLVKPLSEEGPQQESDTEANSAVNTEMEEGNSEEGASTSGEVHELEGTQEDEEEQETDAHSAPQCQNKAIAFIMGCPCSDDDSSQSEEESSDDSDDGFDSDGSSDLSNCSDEDDEGNDEDSDSEADSEAERLWNSLGQNLDPYNPRNFTAQLHTCRTPPRTIPTSSPPSSTQSTPASSPALTLPPLSSLTASSPPFSHDGWDDSTSASEVDEAESLRLLNSFSCSSDPYSPFNFQATLRTRGPVGLEPRARPKKASQPPPRSPHHNPASPPEYKKEEAEERLDSGFSELSTSSSKPQSCSTAKKVHFCDVVEEFFASCGEEEEDRRGPWEELARDRCRFLRRCQEVEQSIAYCLQPQHRSLVAHRLSVFYVQDA